MRAHHSAGVTAEFDTEAEAFRFDYRLLRCCSPDSIDVYADGVPVDVRPLAELPAEGTFEGLLPAGRKRVTVYFPLDSQIVLNNLAVDGSWKNVRHPKKVLWLGDSITQGYGPMMAGLSFVNITNRAFRREVLCQGIGGLRYDGGFVTPMEGYAPEKIVVSLGTNGASSPRYREEAVSFYQALAKVYPNVPTLVVTPLWRPNDAGGLTARNAELVREICAAYPNIRVVDGFRLVPHVNVYFKDTVHPNALGTAEYAAKLIKEIRSLKF